MKKAVAMMLVLLVLLSVLPPGLAAEPTKFVVQKPEALPKAGEEFTVSVELENNPGFCALQFSLAFDDEALECVDIQLGSMLEGILVVTNPNGSKGATVAAATLEPVRANGTAATLLFRAKRDLADWDLHLTITSLDDQNVQRIPYVLEEGTAPGSQSPGGQSPGSQSPGGSTSPGLPGGGGPSGNTPPGGTGAETPTENAPTASVPSFTDTAGHWGEEYIRQAVQAGLFNGYPDNTFRPDEPVTRAQFITVLWRLAGSPGEDRAVPFTDTAGQYSEFRSAIAWGYHQGCIKGTSDTTFSPESTLTRQEALTILYRYAGEQMGMEVMFTGIYDGQFTDSGEIASWAKTAVYWGVYHELIQGVGNNQLAPTGTAGRAQIAKIMLQYQKSIL